MLVRAAAEQVWEAAVDWPRQGEWMWGTRVRGGHGVGAELSAWTGIGPVGFTDAMVITEWDPPRRCVVRHTGSIVRGGGVFEAIPLGRQCEFRWTEQLELPGSSRGARDGRWSGRLRRAGSTRRCVVSPGWPRRRYVQSGTGPLPGCGC